jgi:sporulation protein YlmC with PRC-barrel domain
MQWPTNYSGKRKHTPMKTKLIVLMSALSLACLSLAAQTDDATSQSLFRDHDEAASQRIPAQRLGDLKRAHDVIGREIVDDHDQKLGKVKDLALDLQNGRIAEVIVAIGGTLGMDQKVVAVPPSSFTFDRTMRSLRFTADKDALRNSPEFKVSQWNESTQYVEIRETWQRFGVTPYFLHDRQPVAPVPASSHAVENYNSFDNPSTLPQLGFIARATRLMGTTTLNSLDERLGKVDDLVLDLPAGRIVEVVLSTGGILGAGANLRPVPPEAFRWKTNNTVLTLAATSEAFKVAPHFKAAEWGYALEPATVSEVYDVYRVQPYFLRLDVDLGAQNVRTRTENSMSPAPNSTEQTK